jgi:hypothetical protein
MVPLPIYLSECNRDLVVGEVYKLEPIEERSQKSHGHYFACLNEIWKQLPDEMRERFHNSQDYMRKWALIQTGWTTEWYHVFDTVRDAQASAQRLQMDMFDRDEVGVVKHSGRTVQMFHARSQAMRGEHAMNKREFQESKDDVLEWCVKLIGVTVGELSENAGRAA